MSPQKQKDDYFLLYTRNAMKQPRKYTISLTAVADEAVLQRTYRGRSSALSRIVERHAEMVRLSLPTLTGDDWGALMVVLGPVVKHVGAHEPERLIRQLAIEARMIDSSITPELHAEVATMPPLQLLALLDEVERLLAARARAIPPRTHERDEFEKRAGYGGLFAAWHDHFGYRYATARGALACKAIADAARHVTRESADSRRSLGRRLAAMAPDGRALIRVSPTQAYDLSVIADIDVKINTYRITECNITDPIYDDRSE